MGAIDDYWSEQAAEVRSQFARIRKAHRDSDVKGTGNESIVADLLAENFGSKVVVTNSSIIDALDGRSDEIDVAICNEYQPFLSRRRAEMLIVEGVDAVVQVKARLDGAEVDRLLKNCTSVKRRHRSAHQGDQTFSNDHDVPHFVNRVPYVAFSFESALSPETAWMRMVDACTDIPAEEQPDAVFVLDRFALLNVRENQGKMKFQATDGSDVRGFQLVQSGERTLADFLWFLYSSIARVLRWEHPIGMYNPASRARHLS